MNELVLTRLLDTMETCTETVGKIVEQIGFIRTQQEMLWAEIRGDEPLEWADREA